ncbi:MAG: AAA family ATPase [Polyangiales bacterium]
MLPVGPRLEAVLEVAYRARRPVLLEGPTGIGKSEVVQALAQRLGVGHVVLDLSLLEPPDLVGLPIVENGVTRYATPRILPREGAGILMLEELNRAERYIQQPALQLLSARTLHEYVLPEGWVVFAAINPPTGEYQVSPLDPALRARFLELPVRPDRGSWLAWAVTRDVHPAVLALARAHERVFDDVPPRTWTYVSQLLHVLSPEERADATLMRDVLGGYLPAAWVESLLALREASAPKLEIDVHALLASYGGEAQKTIQAYKAKGETDRLDELVHRLASILRGPEAGVLAAKKQLSLAAFEALLADLPGDQREKLQEAIGGNATATSLVDVSPEDCLKAYAGSRAAQRVAAWKNDPLKHHRITLLVTALRAHIQHPHNLSEIKRSNPMRVSLGHLLAQLGEKWGLPLVETMQKVGITPVRPGS